MPGPAVHTASGQTFSDRGNPIRDMADPTNIHRSTTAGLVINQNYHMDGLIRTVANKSQSPTPSFDPQLRGTAAMIRRGAQQAGPADPVSGLKIPGVRTPNPSGWVSPSAGVGQ